MFEIFRELFLEKKELEVSGDLYSVLITRALGTRGGLAEAPRSSDSLIRKRDETMSVFQKINSDKSGTSETRAKSNLYRICGRHSFSCLKGPVFFFFQ